VSASVDWRALSFARRIASLETAKAKPLRTRPGGWVPRQARYLGFIDLFERMWFLIRDRDSKFSASFDEVFPESVLKRQVLRTRRRTDEMWWDTSAQAC
jgi:hypothetical protein